MSFPPQTITVRSDNNILEFKETLKPNGKGEKIFIYQYSESLTKKGNLLGLTASEFTKFIERNTVE